jgi:hypothetical protein
MYKLTILFLGLVFSTSGIACLTAPPEHKYGPFILYMVADSVVMALVTKENTAANKNRPSTFEFKIVEYIKKSEGNELIETFKREGFPNQKTSSDFEGHEGMEFWAFQGIGNSRGDGSCTSYGKFKVGEKYLIFMGVDHPKATEMIKSKDDRWYRLVNYISKFKT